MTKLEEARIQINDIDQKMAKLFEERMAAVKTVIAYKMENKLAIYDEAREKEVICKNVALIQEEALKPYYEALLVEMMNLSKQYQEAILELSAYEK